MKSNFKFVMLSAMCLFMSSFAFAQRIVSGTIIDAETKEPLIGASVISVGTLAGAQTDVDGKYSFQAPADAKQVVVSFTGYTTQTVDIPASNQVDVALAGGSVLDQVVVTGYGGTLKQKQVASAIVTIKADEFNAGSVTDPTQLLQGKVAGLVIAQPGGDPNGSFSVRLRGTTTIAGNPEPLYVIDDVPGVPIQSVDPNDIEEITVLKDGSASALYGARASAGVIIITTKKGTIGKTYVDFSTKVDVATISNKVQSMSPDEYATAVTAAGGAPATSSRTNWFDLISRNAVSTTQNLAIGGSLGKGSTYRASGTFRNVQGNLIKDGYQQLNGRLSLQQYALNDKLKINLTVNVLNRDAQVGRGEAFYYAVTYNPTVPALGGTDAAKYGGYTETNGFDAYNPLSIAKQSIDDRNLNYVQTAFGAQYELFDGFKIKGLYSLQKNTQFEGFYYPSTELFNGAGTQGNAGVFNSSNQNKYFQTYLDYTKAIDKLNVNATAGYDINDGIYQNSFLNAGHIPSDALGYNAINQSPDVKKGLATAGSFKGGSRIVAFFGRANLSYDEIYNLTVTVRREGSSVLSEGNKFGTFPSVSASVDLNKALIHSTVFEQIKLRAGYGVTGTLPLQAYLTQSSFTGDGNGFYNLARNPSSGLKWEQKAETNIGLDFVAAKGRLSGSFDYYTRNITDLFYNFQTIPPGAYEANGIWANSGSLTSSGFEALLSYDILKSKDTKWRSTLILATNNSTLNNIKTDVLQISPSGKLNLSNIGAPGLNSTPIIQVAPNAPLGQIWTFQYVGTNSVAKNLSGDGKNIGAPTILNRFGKEVLLTGASDSDKIIAGNGLPKLTLGWSNNLSFGPIGVKLNFVGTFGHSIVNLFRVFYENNNAGSISAYNRVKTKYWDPTLTDAQFSSNYVESGSYLRLNYLQVYYDFNLGANPKYVKRVQVYAAANNLFTLTGYTGVDPEVRFNDNGDGLVPGVDRRNTYLSTRTFSLGANFSF